ncbi:MAG TPA: C-GCAxxG-C-C family protein [Clostridiales bacterium]|jgi:C_GCAxxG_C_C family probable redox protein|nr:C-GCAxxG-C-C family protein [Clostridiales bacterium]HRT82684.1 C-GCAxxG-C-C family protein [Oscillospiraceae bacterium]
MQERALRARELFEEGYNCAQSIVGAYHDLCGLDFKQALKLAAPFGGGMGRLREVCGAVTGMFMVLGMTCGYDSPNDDEAKAKLYALVQDFGNRFKAANGSIICRDLLGEDDSPKTHIPDKRTKEYYEKRPCADLIEYAGKMLDDYFKNELEM